jgi:ATP-dependent DNA ligase
VIFAAYQVWLGRRTAVLQALQEFFKTISERERAFASASSEQRENAFVDFLNALELYAAAYIKRLVTGVSRELVKDKLIDSLVLIEGAPHWHEKIEDAVTSQPTFKYLKRFVTKHRAIVNARSAAYRSKNIG